MKAAALRRNASLFLDRALEARGADAPALIACDGTVSWGELLRRCRAFAGLLREHGVRREDRLLVALDDTPLFVVAFLGAIRLGAIPVPVNPYHNAAHFTFFLEDVRPAAVLAGQQSRATVGAAVGACRDGPSVLDERDVDLDRAPEHDRIAETHADDPGFMLYSSGTTGMPRGVVHLQHDVAVAAEGFPRQVLRMDGADVTYASAKLSHAYGLANNLLAPLCCAATAVLSTGRSTPASIAERVRRQRPTLLFAVPTHYLAIMREGLADGDTFASVRLCVSAGERLAPEVWDGWRAATGHEILDAIGSTELLQMYCSNRPGDIRPGSAGTPVPGCALRVVGEDGLSVPPGQVGELHVRSDAALAYYWHDHEATKARCRGEWFATGDHFRVDDDGFYWYEGRTDDMLKVGGLWVSPVEVEDVLATHPQVVSAAVVGVEEEGQMALRAYVVPDRPVEHGPALAGELRQLCKERLARHRFPKAIEFVDSLPTALNGKVQRSELRKRARGAPGAIRERRGASVPAGTGPGQ
jgi:benzoate-CoA ligase